MGPIVTAAIAAMLCTLGWPAAEARAETAEVAEWALHAEAVGRDGAPVLVFERVPGMAFETCLAWAEDGAPPLGLGAGARALDLPMLRVVRFEAAGVQITCGTSGNGTVYVTGAQDALAAIGIAR